MVTPENTMPEEKLPQCWSDDVRMNALFAPFRLKSANPESWEMKMKFWSDMLRQWCRCKNDPVVSATDAKVAFMRKGRTSACLDLVVEECLRSGDLAPLSKYLQILHNGPEGWVKWGARLAFRPAAIAATAISSLLLSRQLVDSDGLPKASIDPTQRFVLESAVKEQAMDMLRNYPNDAEHVGTIDELMLNSNYPSGKRESFEILLGYLVSQGMAVKRGSVIKLAESASKVSPITESDEALHKLLAAEKKLLADADKLTRDADRALDDARVAMKLGNKIAAKNHLRRKRKLLDRVSGCEAALENVKQLLETMRQVDINAAVVNTYKIGTEAMKKGLNDQGLSEDSVYDTMDELKEVLETYSEVEKALAGNVDDSDMQDLERELKELMGGPGAPGGTPGKAEKEGRERDFVFDGEERMIAELNDLSVEDRSPGGEARRRAAREPAHSGGETELGARTGDKSSASGEKKPSKLWYPPEADFLTTKGPWEADTENNLDESLNELCNSFTEINMDERLHPGQRLRAGAGGGAGGAAGARCAADFLVQDHAAQDGVWMYSSNDHNQNPRGLSDSTAYSCSESPGKASGNFQMAPGCERKGRPQGWPTDSGVEDLEKRLKNLRGFES